MLFKTKFRITEIHENGVMLSHCLEGSKEKVNKDIEYFKEHSKHYELLGKDRMIVWA